jgi:large subunit ribosomal protein L6
MTEINETIEIPSGVNVTASMNVATIKGPKGEVVRKLNDPRIKVTADAKAVTIQTPRNTKHERRLINSFIAHIKNAFVGVQTPYKYKLKICSGHFPMNVSVQGENFIIKNFLGEKSPRTMKLKKGVTVKIAGDTIDVESADLDLAGQQASDIETLTHKKNRDLRVFQDGIYMIEKAGEPV